jgi:hypothetical protein
MVPSPRAVALHFHTAKTHCGTHGRWTNDDIAVTRLTQAVLEQEERLECDRATRSSFALRRVRYTGRVQTGRRRDQHSRF